MNLSLSKNIGPGFSRFVKLIALGIVGGYFARIAYIDLMRPYGKAELIGWVLGCFVFLGAFGLVLYYRMKEEVSLANEEISHIRMMLDHRTSYRVEKEAGPVEPEETKRETESIWQFNTNTDSPIDVGEATRKNRTQILDRVADFFGIENDSEND